MSKESAAQHIAKLKANIAYLEQEVALRDLLLDQPKPKAQQKSEARQ